MQKSMFLCAVIPLAALTPVLPAQAQTYTLTTLGSLSGYPRASGVAINNSGEVALTSGNDGNYFRAFTQIGTGPPQALSTAQGLSSFSKGINGLGAVVGYTVYSGGGNNQATVWNSHGTPTVIATGEGMGINDLGEVVGSFNGGGASIYTPGTGVRQLGTFDGSNTASFAYAVNNAGQVVGYSDSATNASHGFLWTPTAGFTDMGTLNGDLVSTAYAINASGEAVGSSGLNNYSGSHAFSWTASGGMIGLGGLGANDTSTASGVNDLGQVVGGSYGDGIYQGFLYTPGKGMASLTSLLSPASQGWVIYGASGINDAGQIIAEGYNGGSYNQAILLTPVPAAVPEASTTVSLGLLLVLGAGVVTYKRKRTLKA